MAKKKTNQPQTIHMMEFAAREGIEQIGAADDLPLFSGQPVTVPLSLFRPKPVARQETLFDIRLKA